MTAVVMVVLMVVVKESWWAAVMVDQKDSLQAVHLEPSKVAYSVVVMVVVLVDLSDPVQTLS